MFGIKSKRRYFLPLIWKIWNWLLKMMICHIIIFFTKNIQYSFLILTFCLMEVHFLENVCFFLYPSILKCYCQYFLLIYFQCRWLYFLIKFKHHRLPGTQNCVTINFLFMNKLFYPFIIRLLQCNIQRFLTFLNTA